MTATPAQSSTVANAPAAAGGLARWTVVDTVLMWLIAAWGAVATVALILIPRFGMPAEDAVILFQYSRNLALTGAITYIPHGVHAEGATDFLWMVLIAIAIKLGAHPFWFVAVCNVLSLAALAWLLLRIAGERFRIVPALFIAGYFALFPQISAAAGAFSVLPFACLLTLLALVFLRQNDVATPAVSLLVCLFRPDGVVFAIPLLCAALVLYPNRLHRFKLDAALFVLPGIAYFLWRWHYFHLLLPLPFLVKADAERVAHIFVVETVLNARLLLLFTATVLCIVLWNRLKDPQTLAILFCFLVLPNVFYLAMRLDQNAGRRFFIYLPVGLAILIAMNLRYLAPRSGLLLRVGVLAWIFFVQRVWIRDCEDVWAYQFDNRKSIGEDLSKIPHGTMIVTEAGVLTYYSGWTAYDAWGLNTERFARHFFQPSDIAAINPDFILEYSGLVDDECVVQPGWHTPYAERTWVNLSRNIFAGASPAVYDIRILPLGNVGTHPDAATLWQHRVKHECWFIRRDSPLHDSIVNILAAHGSITYDQYHQLPPINAAGPSTLNQAPRHGKLHTLLGKIWHSVDE